MVKETTKSIHPLGEGSSELNFINTNINKELLEGLDRDAVLRVFDKTNNSLGKLGEMRGERFDILSQYKGLKNHKEKQGNNIFKFLDKKPTDTPHDILKHLGDINRKEEILSRALSMDIKRNLPILQKGFFDLKEIKKEEDREVLVEFNNNVSLLSELGGKYIQLTNEHKSILDIEKQFINSPDDKLFDIYVNKLVRFKDEFERLMNTNDKDLKQYFSDIKNDITKLRTAIDNKTPLELIKTSFVSAVVRVLVANLLGAAVTGNNPFDNPFFWELTGGTIPAVVVLNYLDYYYSMFGKITNSITKGLSFGSHTK